MTLVGMRGFEPPLSRPPDVRFNRTKLRPERGREFTTSPYSCYFGRTLIIALMRLLVSFFFLMAVGTLSAQLTLVVNALPMNTPDNPQVFVAGNFQGWDAGAAEFELSDMGDGTFALAFSPDPGLLEFKFTRGS